VLFGDSHAAQWFPALEAAARAEGWQFNAWTKSSCPAVDVTIWYPPRRSAFTACNAWRAKILRALAGAQRPDVVFVSNLTDYSGLIADRKTGEVLRGGAADAAWRRGFRTVLTSLTRAGIPVVVIRDTPRTFKSFAACLAEGGGSACDRPRGQALGASPDLDVAREFGNSLAILDLSDRICDAAMCPTTRDGMLVYHDQNHLTATFAATLSADFRKMLASSRQSVDGDAR
jgi:hypothetical protein